MSNHERTPFNLLEPGALFKGALLRDWADQSDGLPRIGELVGVYKIEREIARGGMGAVFLANRDDGQFQQKVAIKCLLQQHNDWSEIWFRRERQTLAALNHPHIARLLDGGQSTSGHPWLAMEFVDGQRLDLHCVENNLAQNARLKLFLQVCDALKYAHAHGILHRDIKPGNVMVDERGQAKLLDFGIATLDNQISATPLAFTPNYASPNQLRGEAATIADDVYQLGRLLQVLLSNNASTHATLLSQFIDAEKTAVNQNIELDYLPNDLQLIIQQACASEVKNRYVSISALIEDLEAFLSLRPISAKRANVFYLVQRFVQRNRIASGVAFLLLLGAIIGGVVSINKIREARDLAEVERAQQERLASFLKNDLLFQGDLHEGSGLQTTVATVIERAEKKLLGNSALPAQDALPLLVTMLEVYSSQFEFDRARKLIARTRIRYVNEWANLSKAAKWDFDYFAVNVEMLAGHPELARPKLMAMLSSGNAPLDSEQYLLVQTDFAWSSYEAGDPRAAKKIVAQFAAFPPSTKPRSDIHRYAEQIRALIFFINDDLQTARILMQQTEAELIALYGQSHPSVLRAQRNIAAIDRESGQCTQAIKKLKIVQAVSLALPELEKIWTDMDLATAHLHCNQAALALPLLQNIYNKRKQQLGADHNRTRQAAIGLAEALRRTNQNEQALILLTPTCASAQQQYGAQHWQYGLCHAELAFTQAALNNSVAAKKAARIALDILEPLPRYFQRQGRNIADLREII